MRQPFFVFCYFLYFFQSAPCERQQQQQTLPRNKNGRQRKMLKHYLLRNFKEFQAQLVLERRSMNPPVADRQSLPHFFSSKSISSCKSLKIKSYLGCKQATGGPQSCKVHVVCSTEPHSNHRRPCGLLSRQQFNQRTFPLPRSTSKQKLCIKLNKNCKLLTFVQAATVTADRRPSGMGTRTSQNYIGNTKRLIVFDGNCRYSEINV